MSKNETQTLLTFPCDFTIKVFGLSSDDFQNAVTEIVRKHIPSASDHTVTSRSSENGKYIALSIVVHVTSKEQLDQIYQDLSANKNVIMAL